MALDSKNPKLISISVSSLQKLISHHAVPESSVGLILSSLLDQINSPLEIQLKILQTVLPLVSTYKSIHGECLADALLLVYKLQETKSPIVSNTAATTLRQMIVSTFEKVVVEDEFLELKLEEKDGSTNELQKLKSETDADERLHPCADDAFSLFQVHSK